MRMVIAAALIAGILSAGATEAQSESGKDAFKKTERGMGRLLEAMGQEVRKLGSTAKKQEKKEKKSSNEKNDEEARK